VATTNVCAAMRRVEVSAPGDGLAAVGVVVGVVGAELRGGDLQGGGGHEDAAGLVAAAFAEVDALVPVGAALPLLEQDDGGGLGPVRQEGGDVLGDVGCARGIARTVARIARAQRTAEGTMSRGSVGSIRTCSCGVSCRSLLIASTPWCGPAPPVPPRTAALPASSNRMIVISARGDRALTGTTRAVQPAHRLARQGGHAARVKPASILLRLAGAVGAAALLAGCGGSGDEAGSASSTSPSTTTSSSGSASPSSASSSASSPASAGGSGDTAAATELPDLVQQMRTGVPEITDALIYDETTDPNDLLGRPNGYTAAASLTDSRASDPAGTGGIDLGAVLEVWPTPADAQARADYIAALQKGNTLLGSEYHHVRGNVLLRVSGQLPPSVNEVYAAVFGA
jgi:hypothetical protein